MVQYLIDYLFKIVLILLVKVKLKEKRNHNSIKANKEKAHEINLLRDKVCHSSLLEEIMT